MKKFLTVREAANLLGVAVQHVHRLIKEGKLRAKRVPPWNYYLVRREDVEKLREKREK
jgi:excisionase family DNA binding protein